MTNNDEIIRLVEQLGTRVAELEAEVARLKAKSDQDIPEDVLFAISAAVSAYLGNRGKVKAVHFDRHRTWAHQGRQIIQSHSTRLR